MDLVSVIIFLEQYHSIKSCLCNLPRAMSCTTLHNEVSQTRGGKRGESGAYPVPGARPQRRVVAELPTTRRTPTAETDTLPAGGTSGSQTSSLCFASCPGGSRNRPEPAPVPATGSANPLPAHFPLTEAYCTSHPSLPPNGRLELGPASSHRGLIMS